MTEVLSLLLNADLSERIDIVAAEVPFRLTVTSTIHAVGSDRQSRGDAIVIGRAGGQRWTTRSIDVTFF